VKTNSVLLSLLILEYEKGLKMADTKEKNQNQNQKHKNNSNGWLSKPVVFALGAATTYVLGATAPSLQKIVDPLVTGTIKQGIRVTRQARGTVSRVGANLADNYAKAQYELEQEERAARNGKSSPRVVKLEDRKADDPQE
jgi:stage V sporulation protein SpoVS